MAAFIFRPQPALDLRRREVDAAQLAVAEARAISDRAAQAFAAAQASFEAGSARAAALDAAGGSITDVIWHRNWIRSLRRELVRTETCAVRVERAQGGLGRLAEILTRMTEATRLEQSLSDVERERFDLGALVTACVEGYRLAFPRRTFACQIPDEPLRIDGAPDLVAQMLDKLVANAHEFAIPDTPIVITLVRAADTARLTVENEGPPLPQGMREQLFDSMVSVRPGSGGDVPHLGLGLYIVRLIAEFHAGTARAGDRNDGNGVIVTVSIPLARDD